MTNASWGTTQIEHGMSERVVLAIYAARISQRIVSKGKWTDVPEAEFTTATIELAQWYGWRVTHFRPLRKSNGKWETAVQGDGKGFPDLLGLREETGQRFVAELKCNSNETSSDQDDWLKAFEVCGTPAFTWYPRDIEEIKTVLKHGAEWPDQNLGRENSDG
ncbi:MAG: VRR-NUC domain-containing protein [Planctomycetes bacterium]|nr:VRR-NUC domain-containing protein [Planctomycetota bacterium]